ncbi:MAG: hypothetical protein HY815_15885 [Candidatus Riflebacteria bacterium]|nr:hypothetical protein [Candidatus Riflebacteria bacterium]
MLKVIDLARETGQTVPSIRIIGIEPESVEPGLELSRALRARFEEYIRAALEEISA